MARELSSALRRIGCACDALRTQAAFLALDLQLGEVKSAPATVPEAVMAGAAQVARTVWEGAPAERVAMAVAGPGKVLDRPSLLAFNASLEANGEEGRARAIYVLLAPLSAWEELFRGGYQTGSLLPEVVAGAQPNDSLLHIALIAPGGHPVFVSPEGDPQAITMRDTLPVRYGGMVVEVAVRPEAAGALVIGGLPRTRLPLLLALILLTVGVGSATLLQIRKEEELARLREDFISGVSHEFRTPLTQISMFTELMAEGKLRTEEEWRRSIAVINREARRLAHLVENILHFSSLGRAPVPPDYPERVALQAAFVDLREAFEPLVRERQALVELTVDPPGALALASRGGLHQILANLLDNALKYGPAGQTILVKGVAREGMARIVVEDEGPGIPPSERERVWRPYYRLPGDGRGRGTGSGIGLWVVRRIAESWGGGAWVEEGRRGGSRFVVELPADAEEV